MYAPPIPVNTAKRVYHTVRRGETLTTVARRYGVAAQDLKRWNPGMRFAPGIKVAVEVKKAPKKRRA
jgi:LysM repeat protein